MKIPLVWAPLLSLVISLVSLYHSILWTSQDDEVATTRYAPHSYRRSPRPSSSLYNHQQPQPQHNYVSLNNQTTRTTSRMATVASQNSYRQSSNIPSKTNSLSSLSVIDILSVGCREQQRWHQAQEASFLAHKAVRHFYGVTEDDDTHAQCAAKLNPNRVWRISTFCAKPKPQYPILNQLLQFFFDPQTLLKKRNPGGWLCAQTRPFDGFRRLVEKYKYQDAKNLPDYLIVVDDDTWVNINHVTQFVTQAYPAQHAHVVAGCLMKTDPKEFNFTVAYGGYGMVWTKQALRRFLMPLQCTDFAESSAKPTPRNKNGHPNRNNQVRKPRYQPLPGDPEETDADFVRSACWQLQQNAIGESHLFESGMSLADVLYAYAIDQPFENAKHWNANHSTGFCMHSDWAWSYFVNFYHLSKPLGHPHHAPVFERMIRKTLSHERHTLPDHLFYNRMAGYNGSLYHMFQSHRSKDFRTYNNPQQCAHGIDMVDGRKKSSRFGNENCNLTAHFCHRITPRHIQTLHQQSVKQWPENYQSRPRHPKTRKKKNGRNEK